jgi:putative endonuclease
MTVEGALVVNLTTVFPSCGMKQPAIYILASKPHGTLYIGVTGNLPHRIRQHRDRIGSNFTRTHRVYRLVHFELFETMPEAIRRETCLKRWNRAWKIRLIETDNPHWVDLMPDT